VDGEDQGGAIRHPNGGSQPPAQKLQIASSHHGPARSHETDSDVAQGGSSPSFPSSDRSEYGLGDIAVGAPIERSIESAETLPETLTLEHRELGRRRRPSAYRAIKRVNRTQAKPKIAVEGQQYGQRTSLPHTLWERHLQTRPQPDVHA
jgi:hypothetical protein